MAACWKYFGQIGPGERWLLCGRTAYAADEPDLIFRRSTVFKLLTPNDKLATYGIDDPGVDGVACHFTVPEKGGFSGWIGVAEEVSDISLACRQVGPIRIKEKFVQGDDMFRQRRSLFFKRMQIVRGCDAKRNVLVYMVYSDKLIDGSGDMGWPPGRGRACARGNTQVYEIPAPDIAAEFAVLL